jgi:anti-sigma B factor antagonist
VPCCELANSTPHVVRSEELSEHAAALIVDGELDLETAPQLQWEVDRWIADGHVRLVIDLSAATFLDCAAIGTLFTAIRPLAAEPEAAVVLAGASGIVRRALELTAIAELFSMFGSLDDAAAGLDASTAAPQDGWREGLRRLTRSA